MTSLKKLSLAQFENKLNEGALILDMRTAQEFIREFIPSSLYVSPSIIKSGGLKKLLPEETNILLIATAEEAIAQLEKAGIRLPEGSLAGGFEAWEQAGNPIDVVISIEADELMMDMKYGNPHVIDVRSKTAFDLSHLEKAEHIPLTLLSESAGALPKDQIYYIYCEDGERSLSLISYLKREGLHNFYHIQGGFKALHQSEAPLESAPPSNLN
jgi:rhodanese-related sulfurtransferase